MRQIAGSPAVINRGGIGHPVVLSLAAFGAGIVVADIELRRAAMVQDAALARGVRAIALRTNAVPLTIDAVRHVRACCMIHPAPRNAIEMRVFAQLDDVRQPQDASCVRSPRQGSVGMVSR